jgi:hypothetical protein
MEEIRVTSVIFLSLKCVYENEFSWIEITCMDDRTTKKWLDVTRICSIPIHKNSNNSNSTFNGWYVENWYLRSHLQKNQCFPLILPIFECSEILYGHWGPIVNDLLSTVDCKMLFFSCVQSKLLWWFTSFGTLWNSLLWLPLDIPLWS